MLICRAIVLSLLLSISSGLFAQSFSEYFKGRYYDFEGKVHQGFIFYSVESSGNYIKFRTEQYARVSKLNTKKLRSFIIKNDSFTVLQNVRMENQVGNLYNEKRFFAQVLATGNVNLYRHYDNADSSNRHQNTQGYYHNSPVYGDNFINFIVQHKGSNEFVGVRKRKYKKFKEQMMEFFKDYPEVQNKIRNNTYRWATLPGLIREVNDF